VGLRSLSAVVGAGVGVSGACIAAAGVWARREAERTLERERITLHGDDGSRTPVRGPAAVRALATTIREGTLSTAGGRTYSETAEYLGADLEPTSDASKALVDVQTSSPVRNPDADLWIRSTTLQTALTQAYMAFRIADLTTALGASLVAAGIGIAAAGRR